MCSLDSIIGGSHTVNYLKGAKNMQLSVGLTFPGSLKDEAVICYISKNFNININIIEASFSTSAGWAILRIDGDKGEVDKVISYLKSRGIQINKVGEKG
jgi:ABC-type methionine transport system ATPase subunit